MIFSQARQTEVQELDAFLEKIVPVKEVLLQRLQQCEVAVQERHLVVASKLDELQIVEVSFLS